MAERIEIDPYEGDPARWGHSLANLAEVLTACLDASESRSVAEIGAYAGGLTRVLLDWATGAGALVIAIEPTPQPRLVELAERHPELELIGETSHVALRDLPVPDAVIVDGDHNYFTVSEELRLIEANARDGALPLLMFHDVGWPHGRRDAYWAPDRVPDDRRLPMVERAALLPGEPGLADHGLPMYSTAKREGGPGNGVLTAIEDFLGRHPELRLAILPPFFGFGVLWRRDAPWSAALAGLVEGWDRNPVLDRLEANRVHHLARAHAQSSKLRQAREELDALRAEGAPHREGRVRRPTITWQGEDRFTVGGESTFQILPSGLFDSPHPSISIEGADFLLAKSRPLVERYIELLGELRPQRVFELGIFQGGSTVFLLEAARPQRLVAIDRRAPLDRSGSRLSRYVARAGVEDSARIYGGVDQADRLRLAEIADREFGDEALDLVVDDCSHLYEATRASFNELFPRLRPGGAYVIEDWTWADPELGADPANDRWSDEIPLTRLVLELVLSIQGARGWVDRISIDPNTAIVWRGAASVESDEFEISARSNARGRRLLAS